MIRSTRPYNRSGFTLVELLVVIAIIGILVGMTVTGIAFARKFAASGRISMEVSQLASAVSDYNLKYGDYPPDFSDATVVNRHFRKAFPKILNSEIALLSNARGRYAPGPNKGIDNAEALVFCLGGFSDDPQKPFTGNGGPLRYIGATPPNDSDSDGITDDLEIDFYVYNTNRKNSIFEFKIDRLTIFHKETVAIRSWDDSLDSSLLSKYDLTSIWDASLKNNDAASSVLPAIYKGLSDPFPAYLPSGLSMPFVYFDSRTYGFTTGEGFTPPATGYYFNNYSPPTGADFQGVARPYKANLAETSLFTGSAAPSTYAGLDALLQYASKNSFQIIAAGVDDHFGGVYGLTSSGTPVTFIAETGRAFNAGIAPASWIPTSVDKLGVDPNGTGDFKYTVAGDLDPLAQQDNVASFTSGTLISNVTE